MFRRLERSVDLEARVRDHWASERIFERANDAAAGKPAWVFYEGPPTANGTPHNGHVLTRVMKDVFPRYKAMRGYRVSRKAGWDTHGLPVEVEVEKQLDVHGKAAIEAYGLERFNRACVDNVFTYIHEWDDLTKDIGFWVDLNDPYVTYHKPYVESVWWALSRLLDKGLLYQGHKVVWWWPQGGTTLSAAEVGLGYKTVDDPAATVRFRDADDPTLSYLAWTTTPWTLPSNTALAVAADVDYAECAEPDGPEGHRVVVAADLAEAFGLSPLRTLKGHELVGRRYTPSFDFGTPQGGDGFRVVVGHHVTTKSGTGIVHIAPTYGEDDMLVARACGLGMLSWVGADGRFVDEAGALAGVWCKDADKLILRDLADRGLLFKRDTIRHEYPFCWRASSDPLIQLARPAWFIRTSAFKDLALANNAAVDWHPEHIRDGRFGDFLRNNVDWALSRERFWGTPLNIWTCEACERRVAPTSLDDLRARGATGIDDTVDEHLRVHRPWIDAVTLPCAGCGGVMRRVPEVIDCWFDSGAMPFAQWGFPHQGVERFRDQFPADFICEAIDQTRGWFYTLLMISTLLFDDETCAEFGLGPVGFPRPYKSCVVLGHVCDRYGLKESKSKGNYTSPNLVMRGSTWQWAVPDERLARGSIGMLKAQVEGLELGAVPARLTRARGDDGGFEGRVVEAEVRRKDAVHVHPDDLRALGLAGDAEAKVWFHLPVEPPGADAFRWLFCASSAPWNNTRLSLRAIQEGQREFLIRLRNVYQFFTIYADIAEQAGTFDPRGEAPRPVADRALLDRWIHHRLQATVATVTVELDGFGLYEASRALLAFVDDLSNWYVRRSRTRFWGEGPDLQDALWTLYEVLRTTSRLVAPFVPFLADALHEALERDVGRAAAPSVHMEAWPSPDAGAADDALAADMALAREVVSLGLAARAASKIKVRQPLQAITVVLADASREPALLALVDMITDELNVREVRVSREAGALVSWQVKPDFRALGPRVGKQMKALAAALGAMDPAVVKARLDAGTLAVEVEGQSFALNADEIKVSVEAKGGFEAASSPVAVVGLHTDLTDDLRAEGFVRELQSRLQALRKEEDLGYTERVHVCLRAGAQAAAVEAFQAGLVGEILCTELRLVDEAPDGEGWAVRTWDVDGVEVTGWMRRA